jgi:hypothetical protein
MLVLRRIKMNLDAIPGRSSPVMQHVLWEISLESQLRPMPTAINTPNIATMITQGFFLMNPITLWILHEVREIFRRKRRPPLTLEPSKNQAAAPSSNIKHAIEAE